MANISTLTVSLVAETGKFRNELKRSQSTAQKFGKAMRSALKFTGIGLGALTGGLGALAAQQLKVVDASRKAARTLGTTQPIYEGLALAADLGGVSMDKFEKALKRQSKSIVDANDGLSTQARAFGRLGLNVQELLALPIEKQFARITNSLGSIENATLRTAIASDIYGSKNADLINLFGLGEKGIDDFIKKADELGLALTEGQTKAIEDANDSLTIMQRSFSGLGRNLVTNFAPSIIKGAEAITAFVVRITNALPKLAAFAARVFGIRREIDQLSLRELNLELSELQAAQIQAQGLVNKLQRQSGTPQFTNSIAGFDSSTVVGLDAAQAKLDELNKRITDLTRRRITLKTEPVEVPTLADDELTSGSVEAKLKAQAQALFRATREPIEQFNLKVAEIRNNPFIDAEVQRRAIVQANDALLREFQTTSTAMQEFQAQADSLFDATRTPVEKFNAEVASIRANPLIDAEVQERAIQQAADRLKDGLQRMQADTETAAKVINEFAVGAARSIQGAFSDFLFDPFEDGLRGMARSFANTIRRMLADLISSRLLTLFAGTGLGKALGLASIASSAPKAAIGGIATGGRTMVVGERGPELFTPGASGAVRPIGAINFAPTTNIQAGSGVDARTLIPILEENNRRLKSELLSEIDRGALT